MSARTRAILWSSGALVVIVTGGAVASAAMDRDRQDEATAAPAAPIDPSASSSIDSRAAGGAASSSGQIDPSPTASQSASPQPAPAPSAPSSRLPSATNSGTPTDSPPPAGASATPSPTGAGAPAPSARSAFSFVDDFSGVAGSPPSRSNWTAQTGAGGWGNAELQTYTAASAYHDGSGHLVIEARRHVDSSGRVTWTSARLSSYGKRSFGFGTLSARIRLPDGQGLLPAFWTMGDSLHRVGWPAAGEIDVVETPNTTTTSSHNSHGPTAGSPYQKMSVERSSTWDAPLSDDFHIYSVDRSPGHVVIRVDDTVVSDFTRASISPDMEWVFDEPQHALLSLAVGGRWPGDPTDATPDVSRLVVDWVRFAPAT